jgi:hypothetical protein
MDLGGGIGVVDNETRKPISLEEVNKGIAVSPFTNRVVFCCVPWFAEDIDVPCGT